VRDELVSVTHKLGCRMQNSGHDTDPPEVSFIWKADPPPQYPQVFNRPLTMGDIKLKKVRNYASLNAEYYQTI